MAGQVYFAKEDKAPKDAELRAELRRDEFDDAHNTCIICLPVIPIIPPIPVAL